MLMVSFKNVNFGMGTMKKLHYIATITKFIVTKVVIVKFVITKDVRADGQEVHLNCPWTVDDDDNDLLFVSTNQRPEFLNPQWNHCYLMKARIVKKQWD